MKICRPDQLDDGAILIKQKEQMLKRADSNCRCHKTADLQSAAIATMRRFNVVGTRGLEPHSQDF